jgi:hypothetical protein
MNWRGCERYWFWPNLRYPEVCMEGLRKTMKELRLYGMPVDIEHKRETSLHETTRSELSFLLEEAILLRKK